MAKYDRCPNCGNIEFGDAIMRCNRCGKVYCDACAGEPVNSCPVCGYHWKFLGGIGIDIDEEEDDS